MNRREYKYFLPTSTLAAFRELILPWVDVDPYAASQGEHEYTVRSLYLDTRALDFYHEKLAGVRERKKIRIRGYNEILALTPVFLEVKTKIGGAIRKRRCAVFYRDLQAFLETGDVRKYVHSTEGHESAQEGARLFLFHLFSQSLVPVITISYEREPYFSKIDRGVRITLDKNLRSQNNASLRSLSRSTGELPALSDRFILEVKTDYIFPRWLKTILARFDANREAISKYTMCIDSLETFGYRLDLTHRGIVPTHSPSFDPHD